MLNAMTTFKKTMSWIGVLPAAFLAVVAVWFPVHWVVMLTHHYNNPDLWGITVNDKSLLALISADTLERFGDAFLVPSPSCSLERVSRHRLSSRPEYF
jgi:hypothetical protein